MLAILQLTTINLKTRNESPTNQPAIRSTRLVNPFLAPVMLHFTRAIGGHWGFAAKSFQPTVDVSAEGVFGFAVFVYINNNAEVKSSDPFSSSFVRRSVFTSTKTSQYCNDVYQVCSDPYRRIQTWSLCSARRTEPMCVNGSVAPGETHRSVWCDPTSLSVVKPHILRCFQKSPNEPYSGCY